MATTEELFEMYSTGRGSFKIQANWRQEKNQLIVDALPYQASGSKILEQISEQMLNKKHPMVVDLADEGDHEFPVRLVITLKSNRVNAEDLMNHLFASTDLQKSYRMNMNLISLGFLPFFISSFKIEISSSGIKLSKSNHRHINSSEIDIIFPNISFGSSSIAI